MADSDVNEKCDEYSTWFEAVKNCQIDRLDVSLRDGFDINCTNQSGRTALIIAAMNFDGGSTCSYLLSGQNIDVNLTDKDGNTALMTAIKHKRGDICQLLLNDDRVDLNKANNNGDTPLIYMSTTNLHYLGLSLARNLLQKGAELNRMNDDGHNAMDIAYLHGYNDLMDLLNYYGLKLSLDKQWFDALNKYQIYLLRNLLEQGVDINSTDEYGQTALILAVMKPYSYDICDYLLSNDIDINKADKDGTTPLIAAIKHKRKDVIWLLLANSELDIDQADNQGNTPLMWTIRSMTDHLDLIENLLQMGAKTDCFTNDIQQRTAMDLAMEKQIETQILETEDSDLVAMLKRYGANRGLVPQWIELINKYRFSTSIDEDLVDKLDSLLERGVDINCTNRNGYTALMLTTMHANYDLCRYLLTKDGIDPNKENDCDTALIFAINHHNRSDEMAWLLVNHDKVDLNNGNEDALRDALRWAQTMNKKRVEQRIKEKLNVGPDCNLEPYYL